MKAYINATSAISSQNTFDENSYMLEWVNTDEAYLKAVEPNYREYLDPKMARRMARIIKMGVTTANKCLVNSKKIPGAIILGTGLGCLQDTARFLTDIIHTEEGLLSPTAFIQSTHNTIAGQIALLINCPNHNFTFANRGFSFENALRDALMQLEEGKENVLVGALDEVIPESKKILNEIGCFEDISNEAKKTPILGEGATMFLLSAENDEHSMAVVEGMRTIFQPNGINEIKSSIDQLLKQTSITLQDIDGVVLGYNGIATTDTIYNQLAKEIFEGKSIFRFKNISGEYFTASAFGMHLGVKMIENQHVYPSTLLMGNDKKEFNHIIVYNHFGADYHSIVLLSKC